ncbi:MAG: DUF3192 domain-containing protein [Candidatus Omnitrophota bacterium]
MKKFLIVLLCLGLVGCASRVSLSKATAPTRENLIKISIGMSKQEVINIMGTETKEVYYHGGLDNWAFSTINNPYRSEILQGKEKTLEVIYYVTDDKNNDGAISDDELTPLVFDKSKLIG